MKLTTITTLAIAAALVIGCSNNGNGKQTYANEPTVISYDDNPTDASSDIYLNQEEGPASEANDLARFLAGKSNDKYAALQTSDYYKNYSATTEQTWDALHSRTINPIKEWCQTNIPAFYNDTTTLVYPFGGPDMIFAMTFFPKAKDYVIMGLEKPGELCAPDELSETELHQYLDSLAYSMRYVNKYGFFIAAQMAESFRNKNMDGTIHVVLYSLALNDCIITNHRNIYIDDHGDVKENDGSVKNHPYGWELSFRQPGDPRTRTVKYIRMDLSDEMIKGKMEFPFFLNSIKQKICYMKSASYLMQSVEFDVVRKLLLDQFDRILQDESGFAYGRLIKDYDVKLFGSYTRPLKSFSIFKQEDLMEALEGYPPLPFKIGYAAQHNESVLMACVKKDPNSKNTATTTNSTPAKPNTNNEGIVYKVQFLVSWKMLPKNAKEFSGISGVEYYTDNDSYKYTAGSYKSEAECKIMLQTVRAKGYEDAFIVKFNNGKRIK